MSVIVAVAVMLLIDVLFGFAIHHTVATGTCSSTGYTQFGPAPVCPKGTGWYSAIFPLAIVGTVVISFVISSNLAVPTMFVAMGTGALVVGLDSATASGDRVFPLIFGGCFVIAGLGWGLGAGRAALKRRPARPRAAEPPVASIAGLGPVAPSGSIHVPSTGVALRLTIAVVAWVAAVAGAIGIGTVLSNAAGTTTTTASAGAAGSGAGPKPMSTDITRAPLPRPTGAAAISATDSASMFKPANLGRALNQLTQRFGADENVVTLALYPGELELVVADNDGHARLVSASASDAPSVGTTASFQGSRQAVNLSQLSPTVPQRLAREIQQRGGVPTRKLDRFELDLSGGRAHWQVYPTSGGTHFRALLTGGSLERVSPSVTKALN